jgi:hypothetical protein
MNQNDDETESNHFVNSFVINDEHNNCAIDDSDDDSENILNESMLSYNQAFSCVATMLTILVTSVYTVFSVSVSLSDALSCIQ